jgi:hypothetical protein
MEEPASEGVGSAPPLPRAPEPGECCQSGCERCVYDVYWDALARYEAKLEASGQGRAALAGHRIAEREHVDSSVADLAKCDAS